MGDRGKRGSKIKENGTRGLGVTNGELMHCGIKQNDIVNHGPASDAFLCMANFAINNFTKSEFQRASNKLRKSVGE